MNSQTITDTGPASQGYFAGDVKPDKPAIACVTAAHPRKKHQRDVSGVTVVTCDQASLAFFVAADLPAMTKI